jgi:toxin-antitoxin system PIN domain toxin
MIPDVNVLVAAFRTEHEAHRIATKWLQTTRQKCRIGSETLTLVPVVISGFLRVVTNSRIFQEPEAIEDAVEFIDGILSSPGATLSTTGQDWPLFRSKLLRNNLQGSKVTDAWIASIVESLSEHLVTLDRDFIRLLPKSDLTILR